MPLVVFHTISWCVIFGIAAAQVYVDYLGLLDTQVQLLISEFLLHVFVLLYMTIHPLICVWSSEILRKESTLCCSPCFNHVLPPDTSRVQAQETNVPNPEQNPGDTHFEMLDTMWAKPDNDKGGQPLLKGREPVVWEESHEESKHGTTTTSSSTGHVTTGHTSSGARYVAVETVKITRTVDKNNEETPRSERAPLVKEESGLANLNPVLEE